MRAIKFIYLLFTARCSQTPVLEKQIITRKIWSNDRNSKSLVPTGMWTRVLEAFCSDNELNRMVRAFQLRPVN